MKSAFVHGNPLRVEIRDVGIPIPAHDEVLIRVVYCGANPKDWKMPEELEKGKVMNQGQDMSGYVETVGKNVLEFRKGDRVAAAHPMLTPCMSSTTQIYRLCIGHAVVACTDARLKMGLMPNIRQHPQTPVF